MFFSHFLTVLECKSRFTKALLQNSLFLQEQTYLLAAVFRDDA